MTILPVPLLVGILKNHCLSVLHKNGRFSFLLCSCLGLLPACRVVCRLLEPPISQKRIQLFASTGGGGANNIMNHQQLSSTLFRSLHLMASVFRPEELFSSSCCEWRIYWTVPRWMLWLRKYNYFIPGRFTFHSIEVTVDWRSHSVGPLPYDDDAVAISFTCVWLSALHLLAISLSALLAPQSIQPSILNLSSARPSAQEPKESSTMILRALFQF